MRRLAARRWVTVWQMRLTLRDGGLGMGIAGVVAGILPLARNGFFVCNARPIRVPDPNCCQRLPLPQKAEIRAEHLTCARGGERVVCMETRLD